LVIDVVCGNNIFHWYSENVAASMVVIFDPLDHSFHKIERYYRLKNDLIDDDDKSSLCSNILTLGLTSSEHS